MSKIQSHISNCFIPFCELQDVMHQGFVAWAEKEYKEKKKKDIINNDMDIIKNDFETIKDERGEIRKIAQNVDVLQIVSLKGSRRASHYHKTSSHLCVLLSGSMTYYEKPSNQSIRPTKIKIEPGYYFYTGPQIDHLMVFEADSIFDCYSYGSRNKEDYENDLVRIPYDLEEIYNNWKD